MVPSRKQFNLQKILFYCTFPEEEKEETNAIETEKKKERDKNIRSQSTIEASVMVTVSNSLLLT